MLCLVLLALAACSSKPPAQDGAADASLQPTAAAQHLLAGNDPAQEPPTCPQTEPAWITPPDDAAVLDPPQPGYYFVNEDSSIWASAWWTGRAGARPQVSEDGIKVGWFRPAGATLTISGQRLDAQAAPFAAEIPCCYPTRFQATGLYFPSEGCWEVTARAGDRELSFVVWVEP